MTRARWAVLASACLWRPAAAAPEPPTPIVALSTQASAEESVSIWASVARTDGPHLAAIESDLKFGAWNARIHAVHELEPYGSTGRPLLEYAARDADWQVRLTAVHFLGRQGRPALPALAEILKEEPCRHVRITAIHWLGSMGEDASDVIAETLADESGMARLMGRYWLQKLGQEAPSGSTAGLDTQAAEHEDIKACRSSLRPGRLASAKRPDGQPPPSPPGELAELELPAASTGAPAAAPPRPSQPAAAISSSAAVGRPSVEERETELDKLLSDNPPEDLPDVPALPQRQGVAATQAPAMAQVLRRRGEPDLSLAAAPESMPPGPPGAAVAAPERPTVSAAEAQARPGPRPGIAQPAGPPEVFPKSPPGTMPAATPPPEVALAQDHGQPRPENDPLPELILTLRRGDAPARARAADEVGKRGARAASAMPALMEDLQHPDRRVRASAALALGNIGAAADQTVPALVRALKDRSEDVQWSAAVALGRVGTPRARRAFRRYLRDQTGRLARPDGPPQP